LDTEKKDNQPVTPSLLFGRLQEKEIELFGATFKVRSLDSAQIALCSDGAVNQFGVFHRAKHKLLTIQHGLTGWRGIPDAAGHAVLPEREKRTIYGDEYEILTNSMVKRLHPDLVAPLYDEIMRLSVLSDDEKKSLRSTGGSSQQNSSA